MGMLHEATYYLGLATGSFIGSGVIAAIAIAVSPAILGVMLVSGLFGAGAYAAASKK